jgi:hypothetical protein
MFRRSQKQLQEAQFNGDLIETKKDEEGILFWAELTVGLLLIYVGVGLAERTQHETLAAITLLAGTIQFARVTLRPYFREAATFRNRVEQLCQCAKADYRPPVLFLRSFANTILSETATYISEVVPTAVPGVIRGGGVCYSLYIGKAVKDRGCLVVLGNGEEALGKDAFNAPSYGQLFSLDHIYLGSLNDDWFEMFIDFAASSQLIIVIPEATTGIRREIRYLIEKGLTRKVLVFIPPTKTEHGTKVLCAERWESVRAYWMRYGLQLPPHHPDGLMYRPDLNWGIDQAYVFRNEDTIDRQLVTGLSQLAPEAAQDVAPLSLTIEEQESKGRFLWAANWSRRYS